MTSEQPFEPEGAVVLQGVGALVATVAVEAVGINHEIEMPAGLLEGVDEDEGVLEVDVVVAGAVGEAEHRSVVAEI